MKRHCGNLHVILQLLPPLFSALPIQRVEQSIPAQASLLEVGDVARHAIFCEI